MFRTLRILDKGVIWPDAPYYPAYCVYGLFKGGDLMYVGQSVSLWNRIYDHVHGPLAGKFDYIWWAKLPTKKAMDYAEAWLINQMKPPHNIRDGFLKVRDAA